ncbi:MAG: DUF364 domain-containing protein, partial [Syntrophales bacterium]|nr:DUF364 domain-containing protein [Syntrophales bacterium]
MTIADAIKNHVQQHSEEKRVTDVRMGLGYTGVCLDDGGCGVAFTFKDGLYHGCSVFTGKRPLVGKSSHEIVDYFGSSSLLESALGLSTINALVNDISAQQAGGDILSMLQLTPQDRVGMVGYFGPLVNPIRKLVRELVIFEIDEDREAGV